MPTAQIELGDGQESLNGVFDVWNGEEELRMRHETVVSRFSSTYSLASSASLASSGGFILCNAFQHGAGLEDEGGQRDSAQISAWAELRDDV